jgi:long-chain acyl-CoA synthetase
MEWINAISPDVSGPGRIGRIALPDMVRRSARKYPQKVAIVDGARRVTYAAFDADIDRLANALVDHGLRKGDRVATLGANSYDYLVAMFGIQRAGLVWLPINHNLRPDDIAFVLDHAEPRFAIVDDALYAGPIGPVVDARLPADALAIVSSDRAGSARRTFDAFLATGAAHDPNVAIDDRDVCQIMYTSGTTGRPKGVMHSHLSVYVALLGNLIDYEMRASDISNAMLPLFHCAQHCLVAGAFLAGQTVVVMRSVDPGHLIETIAREKVTVVLSLPPIYGAMLDHPARASHDLSSVRLCIYGMMQMPEHTLRRLVAEVCPNFALGTGQTEIYPSTLTFKPELQLEKIGPYWGDSCVGTETAIMDDAGNLLGAGEIGEIVHRGPNVMAGYFRDPEATEKARAFGWHHTGDLGMFDADGLLIFTDRKKDMIKSGGENVASIVVERALLAHCKEHLSIHEVPKAIRFVEQFPLTATGKIQKNLLRERFADVYEEAGTAAR